MCSKQFPKCLELYQLTCTAESLQQSLETALSLFIQLPYYLEQKFFQDCTKFLQTKQKNKIKFIPPTIFFFTPVTPPHESISIQDCNRLTAIYVIKAAN